MDISIILDNIVTAITTLLPYLVKSSEKFAEEIGKDFGKKSWKIITRFFNKLHSKITSNSSSAKILDEYSKNLDDDELKSKLVKYIKDIISKDEELFRDGQTILELLEKDKINIQQNAGNNSIQIGISGKIFIKNKSK